MWLKSCFRGGTDLGQAMQTWENQTNRRFLAMLMFQTRNWNEENEGPDWRGQLEYNLGHMELFDGEIQHNNWLTGVNQLFENW